MLISSPISLPAHTEALFISHLNSEVKCHIEVINHQTQAVIFRKDIFPLQQYEKTFFTIHEAGEYIVKIDNQNNALAINYFVFFNPQTIYEDGATFLQIEKNKINVITPDKLADFYSQNDYRLQYHFSPYKNWNNDPNGLIDWRGYYHLFYQYYPHEPQWGNMHWGHAISKDLIHWKHFPIALFPNDDLNKRYIGGAFSGSAIDDHGLLTLAYTDHYEDTQDETIFIEKQSLARSQDGIHFTHNPKHPVIDQKPENASKDFRDPKVWQDEDGDWKMVLGSAYNGIPSVLLYRSTDLKTWYFEGPLYQEKEIPGRTIECPDFFKLGNVFVLLMSIFQENGEHKDWITRYYIGDYDGRRFKPYKTGIIDFGVDFYAIQTFLDHQDRRIGIAWMENWKQPIPSQAYGFAGAMTLPRELSINTQNELYTKPVKETEQLRQQIKPNFSLTQTKMINETKDLEFKSTCCEIKLEIEFLTPDASCQLLLRSHANNNEYLSIQYDLKTAALSITIHQTNQQPKTYRHQLPLIDRQLKLHLFLDRSSLELFANNYQIAGTVRMYINPHNQAIKLISKGTSLIHTLECWHLNSSWT